ncbi:MAG: aminoacyl-tRNA hydrolase [Candidatus Riflebacteria bacterium]|nr:aminoacyl-tRNA hydrolase [Candidatus Riflebacteria bacterium]
MLIVGLGNPGKEYENTRHNAGFWCADKLASHFAVGFSPIRKYQADIAVFKYNSNTHYLLKPLTYMNNSGEAVWAFLQDKNIETSKILVIEDDINLPVGRIRLRANGSAGGHNGLKSIISKIGEDFWRLRIGVGQPQTDNSNSDSEHEKLISHVLGEINPSEAIILRQVIKIIPELAQDWLNGEGSKVMNKFNPMKFT